MMCDIVRPVIENRVFHDPVEMQRHDDEQQPDERSRRRAEHDVEVAPLLKLMRIFHKTLYQRSAANSTPANRARHDFHHDAFSRGARSCLPTFSFFVLSAPQTPSM